VQFASNLNRLRFFTQYNNVDNYRREDARDAVIIHPALKVNSLAELPKGSIVGELTKIF
jgi:hypothetical protein